MMLPWVIPAVAMAAGYYYTVRYGRLSPNFTVWELIQSATGGPQWPTPLHLANLQRLVSNVLQPWRDLVGPLRVTSGVRHEETNEAVGGVSSSHHLTGLAVDVVPTRMSLDDALDVLAGSAIPFHRAILYPGHIHVAFKPGHAERAIIR